MLLWLSGPYDWAVTLCVLSTSMCAVVIAMRGVRVAHCAVPLVLDALYLTASEKRVFNDIRGTVCVDQACCLYCVAGTVEVSCLS